ncbi:cytochrome C [Reyranella soli]|uniref:Cytochrome c n=1 Tax=Reyranella soli TaxID=1230389 RepID=A0A512NCW5_9HYPH|nr:cytochrome C [Reyranella soli]GEP56783.1 cytochrome c [Reyranella soli]
MTTPRLAILGVVLMTAFPAIADDRVPPVTDPVVIKECGSCHMPFQPVFLPARSWRALLHGLGDHFGEDATLPPETVDIIRAYMTANAGDVIGQGAGRKFMRWVAPNGTPKRITENPVFLKEHNFPESVWKDPKVVTKSNCLACHPAATNGRFE